jgi:hypothetical protein
VAVLLEYADPAASVQVKMGEGGLCQVEKRKEEKKRKEERRGEKRERR